VFKYFQQFNKKIPKKSSTQRHKRNIKLQIVGNRNDVNPQNAHLHNTIFLLNNNLTLPLGSTVIQDKNTFNSIIKKTFNRSYSAFFFECAFHEKNKQWRKNIPIR
jgi:hypothetical protein